MAWYHVGGCDCPIGCCGCGGGPVNVPVYRYEVEFWSFVSNEWKTMKFEKRSNAVDWLFYNDAEIARKRMRRKLGRRPRLRKLDQKPELKNRLTDAVKKLGE